MKMNVNELSIFGGSPSFKECLHVGRPNIGNKEKFLKRIEEILDRRWLTNSGVMVKDLEKTLENYLGVKHCITMCNGTIALEILARAMSLNGEVIVPSFTFIATAHSLQWQEITPVFCDIDPETHNIDPYKIEKLITPRTTGIIAVHLWGRPCQIDKLTEIADKHNLKLLFDASHAFGCSYNNKMIGSFGCAETFSFHATKIFNSFEGGAVATNDDSLARKIRLMKNFGFHGLDNVVYIGINGKMTEVSAAMGLTSFESINEFIASNKKNYDFYLRYLNHIPGIKVHQFNEKNQNNYQYIILEVDKHQTNISRDCLMRVLHAENILARRYFYPGCHRMEPYRSYYPNAGMLLPETERVSEKILSLPTGATLTNDDIKKICQLIYFVVQNGKEINEKLLKINRDDR